MKQYLSDRDWKITPGSEGKPPVFDTYRNGKAGNRYQTYADTGIEPFLFSKYFSYDGGRERYVDIGEEFVLYFKLYERIENKQNRTYYFIDDLGELVEVIIIKQGSVKVRLSYLKEYL